MQTKFTRDYYQKTKVNNKGEDEVQDKLYKMWHLRIEEDYFIENRKKALDKAISDLEKELIRLKTIRGKEEKAMESWDSISK